jgi:polar amino acid transport system substrate-binding protein
MRALAALALLIGAIALPEATARAADALVLHELAPTGVLRVAIGVGPAPSGFYTTEEPSGERRGVSVELGRFLAYRLGVPVLFVPYRASGEIQNSANSGMWDVTFLPVDEERKLVVDFGNAYHLLESSYLVAPRSTIATLADANRRGVRIVGVRDTATFRASNRASPMATHIAVDGPEQAIAMLNASEADAIALGRESLTAIEGRIAGSRVLDGSFLDSTTAVAVPQGRPAGRAYVSAFIEGAKASGLVRRAFDSVGLRTSRVAPPGMAP